MRLGITQAHISRNQQLLALQALQQAYTKQSEKLSSYKQQVVSYQLENEQYKQQTTAYKQKANYWESQFSRLKEKETELQSEIEILKAKLRKREQQLFGKKTEKHPNKSERQDISVEPSKPKKNRGQQPGSQGHGRRQHDHLPVVEEELSLLQADSICSCCGLCYETLPGTEDSEVIEIINVKAYKRRIRRKCYRRKCTCKDNPDPEIMSAPPAEKVLPKSSLGISVWAHLLLRKYEYQQPLNRTLKELSQQGLSLAQGSVTEGFHKLMPHFMPIYDAIVQRSLSSKHWHADETTWRVFEDIKDKPSNRWYLWIFQNSETAVFKISPNRSAQLLNEHFGNEHPGGILNVDRYVAYKAIAKTGLFILAFCWAHVRRDFLAHAKGYPKQEQWSLSWVTMIGNLYHINNQRISAQEKQAFKSLDEKLQTALTDMRSKLDEQLKDDDLHIDAKALLISLDKHWDGLTVFAKYPEVPMDNNTAERGLRPPVIGRKSYYGSGAVWSFELAALMFTILTTMKLWGVNIHTWLLAYLHECAIHGGCAPDHPEKFLPWNMNEKQKSLFSAPPKYEDSS